MNKQAIFAIGVIVGVIVGGVYVTYTKAGQLANIVIERNEQLQALQQKHQEEVAEIYASFKEKGMDALEDMSTEEITQTAESEIISVIEDTADTWHVLMGNVRGERPNGKEK